MPQIRADTNNSCMYTSSKHSIGRASQLMGILLVSLPFRELGDVNSGGLANYTLHILSTEVN